MQYVYTGNILRVILHGITQTNSKRNSKKGEIVVSFREDTRSSCVLVQ